MIYVTGDTHGAQERLSLASMPYSKHWNRRDTLIVCGDFGFVMNGTNREETFLRELSLRPYTICFVDGNRENYSALNAFPVTEWNGGLAQRLRKNVIHLMRGQLYKIGGQRIFTMGGGYSFDKSRRVEGVDWWPEEMPSPEEYKEALYRLEKSNMETDYIITHAAPLSVVNGMIPPSEEEKPLNLFLDHVKAHARFKRWYFGHYHLDAALEGNLYAMFMTVRELESGEMIW